MTMKACVLVAPEQLEIVERLVPEPGPGEVRVAVRWVGICGTDLEFYRGHRSAGYPFVLGHECAGRIDAVGRGVDERSLGATVTFRPNFSCGSCELCQRGAENLCPHSRGLGVTVDGCLAEYVIVPERYLCRLPDDVDLAAACLIEPVAVAERAVRRGNVSSQDRVLVLGAGPIGVLAVHSAAAKGAAVTAVDPVGGRRAWAARFGARRTLTPEASASTGTYDVVIETAGIAATVPAAVAQARPGGRVVLTGIPMDAAQVETKWVVWRELTVIGSFIYDADDFARACRSIERGEIRPLELVTHRFPFQQVGKAFATAAAYEGLKILIEVQEEER